VLYIILAYGIQRKLDSYAFLTSFQPKDYFSAFKIVKQDKRRLDMKVMNRRYRHDKISPNAVKQESSGVRTHISNSGIMKTKKDPVDMSLAKWEQQGIECRLATPEDALDAVSFHNSYYGTQRRPEDWLWEYQTYKPDKTVFVIAKHGDRVVATMGRIPFLMEVGGKCVLSGKGENLLFSPAYRGTGFRQALVDFQDREAYARGMQFHWGFGETDAFFGRREFTTFYRDIEMWERIGDTWLDIALKLRDNAPLWRRVGSAAKLFLKYFFTKKPRVIPQVEEKAGYQVRKARIPYEQLRELHERVKSKNKDVICIKYDRGFISWRVRNHPLFKYDEYQVCQAGQLRAYAFVCLFEGQVSISDLLSEDKHATSLLLSTIIESYQRQAGRFWFMANPMDYLYAGLFDQLREFGFSLAGKWLMKIKDIAGGKDVGFYDVRNWHVTGLWTEGFAH
jgi:GNAT superfamily N-acetyltransferase